MEYCVATLMYDKEASFPDKVKTKINWNWNKNQSINQKKYMYI